MSRWVLFFVFFFACKGLYAQNIQEDLFYVLESTLNKTKPNTNYYSGVGNSQQMMKSSKKEAKYNPLFGVGKIAMYCYQNIISPQLFRDCPYEVTCSNYCKMAIEKKGLLKGTILGAERLLRCNKMSMLDITQDDRNNHSNKITDLEL